MTEAVAAPANFRDLGGLRTQDGRRLREGLLFRSEFPHWLMDGSRPAVVPRTVVDLRRCSEISLEDVDWIGGMGTRVCRISLASGSVAFAEAHADSYLASGHELLAVAVSRVVAPGALPAHFFCAGGKDRTGLLAIVVLELLGVVREDIARDFAATGAGIADVLDRLARHSYYRELFGERPPEAFQPVTASMDAVLAWLEENGGAEAWAVSAGIRPDWIMQFREAVLTDC